MRQLIAILIILVGGLVLTTTAKAGDVDDVKAAVLAVDAAYNSGDVEAIAQYMHSEHSRFPAGGLLSEGFDKEALKASFDAGLERPCKVTEPALVLSFSKVEYEYGQS